MVFRSRVWGQQASSRLTLQNSRGLNSWVRSSWVTWLKVDLIPVNVFALMNMRWEDWSTCFGSPSPTAQTQSASGSCQDPPVTTVSALLWSWWPGWWLQCSCSYWGLLIWEAPASPESPPVLTVDRTRLLRLWTNVDVGNRLLTLCTTKWLKMTRVLLAVFPSICDWGWYCFHELIEISHANWLLLLVLLSSYLRYTWVNESIRTFTGLCWLA